MPTQLPPGWYPDPEGKPRKLYWDGSEWYTTIPASHKHGSTKLFKILTGASLGLTALLAVGALVFQGTRGNPGATPPSSPSPTQPAPTTTTSRYVSEKMMPADGMYRVGGDQVDPGVWESDGPAPGLTHCAWARLSAPQETPETTIEAGGSDAGPTQVRVLPTDAAFATHGCQPWRMVAK